MSSANPVGLLRVSLTEKKFVFDSYMFPKTGLTTKKIKILYISSPQDQRPYRVCDVKNQCVTSERLQYLGGVGAAGPPSSSGGGKILCSSLISFGFVWTFQLAKIF